MWAVVRYDYGDRQSENQKGPSVQVDVYDTEYEAKLRGFALIESGSFILKYNLFIVEVENR